MERQGYQFSLRRYGNGDGAWAVHFSRDVATSAHGFGRDSSPWKAIQIAAWAAVKRTA